MSGLFLGLVASMSFTRARRFLEYWLDTLGNFPLMIFPARPFKLRERARPIFCEFAQHDFCGGGGIGGERVCVADSPIGGLTEAGG